jgi:hypothetical protein
MEWKESLRSTLLNNAPGAVAASKQLVWTVTQATDDNGRLGKTLPQIVQSWSMWTRSEVPTLVWLLRLGRGNS